MEQLQLQLRYREFIELLYQDPQPLKEIESLISLYKCDDILPEVDGEYLVYHTKYGYCTYGYTVKDKWGLDDEVINRDGSRYNKVTHWGKLDFLRKD